jgi:hypothetical protein
MKRIVLGASAIALLSAIALTAPAQAASYRHGSLSSSERLAIANSQKHLNALKWRVRADGHVSLWERMRLRAAQSRHNALVFRLNHN